MKRFEYGRQLASYILVFVLLYFIKSPTSIATEVVVNKSVPTYDLSTAEARAVFSMQKTVWPNGEAIKVFNLPDNHPTHKNFVKNILHLLPHQLKRIWDRMTYSGTGQPPIEVDSEQEMMDKVAHTPGAIGYLDIEPHDENVHVLK